MLAELVSFIFVVTPTIDFVHSETIPSSAVDQHGNTFTITGLSGLVWGGETSWYGVMDNSSHVVKLDIYYDEYGYINVEVIGGLEVDRYGDYEDISFNSNGTFILSDENTQNLLEFNIVTGEFMSTYDLHGIYQNRRSNLGCEAYWSSSSNVWIGNEEALSSDGPRSTPDNGTLIRLTNGDIADLSNSNQFVYEVDQMPGPYIPITGDGQSGLVAIIESPSGLVLTLERSLAFVDALFKSKIYSLDYSSATNVMELDSLKNAEFDIVTKELLYEGPHQNMEGLAMGPELGDGRYLILGIVDDGDPISSNRVCSFILQDEVICAEDLNNDYEVGVSDLLIIIDDWGPVKDSESDFNSDGIVDVVDLLQVVSAWGPC